MISAMLGALAILAAGTGVQAQTKVPAPAHVIEFERFGLFVVVEDVDRASVFYEKVFGRKPQIRTPSLIGFDLAGGLFALASRTQYAPRVQRGDSTVPYIKVASVEALFKHVKTVAPASLQAATVTVEGPFRFFKIRDPDGNVVEFFSVGQIRK